jgi:hypothetical protein
MTEIQHKMETFLLIQENFLEAISQEILPEQNSPITKILCFKFRFNFQNFNLKHRSNSFDETTITSLIKEELNGGFSDDGINQYIKDICATIQKYYQTEIVKYVNNKSDLNGETWRWEEVYNWLWNDKFPRWFWSNKLVKLVEPNKKYLDWISFMVRIDNQRGIAGKPRHSPAILPLNVGGHFYITINSSDYYLLLLNLGADKKNINLICPSEAFAPSYFVKGHEILIPSLQGNSDYGTINFEQEGEEEFIAIVLKQPLDLPWLDSDRGDDIPILEQEQIKELWNFLIDNNDWEIFYKSFKVVKSHITDN